jgi:hypothetical protein
VHDYSNEPVTSGIKHVLDITTFNSKNTQALTKRIECLEREGLKVEILNTQIMSPISGSSMIEDSVSDEIFEILLDDDVEVNTDVKFVRDKYTFIQKNTLPREPIPLSKDCTRQVNEGSLTDECRIQLNIYSKSMAEYKKQVNESRNTGTFRERRIGFAPMNEKIEDNKKYPFSQPQSFGFVAHENVPIDYSALTLLKPLEDEKFFNSVALENSSLAIQYG